MFNLFAKNIGLGIEISTKYVRYSEVLQEKGVQTLVRFGRVKISQTNDSEYPDYEEIANIIKPILKDSQAKKVRVVLPEDTISFFNLLIPKVSSKELKEHIVLGLKENVSFHEGVDELLDYQILVEEDGVYTVRAVTASKKFKETAHPLLSVLARFDTHLERANQAALVATSGDIQKPSLHIQFGDDVCTISGVFAGAVQMYQEIPFSTYRFLTEIQKRLTQPAHTASNYLSTIGVYGADTVSFAEEALRPFSVVLDHAITSFGKKINERVEFVTLGGMFAGYKGVDQMVGKMVRVPVSLAYPWKPTVSKFDDSIFRIKKHETLEYLTSLGLAELCLN